MGLVRQSHRLDSDVRSVRSSSRSRESFRGEISACRETTPAVKSNGKVRNLMEVGWTLRSSPQVQSDWYPGAPAGVTTNHPRVASLCGWKAHEGRASAQRPNWMPRGGERSREHRLRCRVTPATGVRTLSRSKTLKSRAHAHQRLLLDDLKTNPVLSSWTSCIIPPWVDWPIASLATRLAVRSLLDDVDRLHWGSCGTQQDFRWIPTQGRRSQKKMGAKIPTSLLEGTRAGSNDKRGMGVERHYGWLRGKSSEGRNPMGGSGVK